jgi:hypothetical protein
MHCTGKREVVRLITEQRDILSLEHNLSNLSFKYVN